MTKVWPELDAAVKNYIAAMESTPDKGACSLTKVLSSVLIMNALEDAVTNPTIDYKPGLVATLGRCADQLREVNRIASHINHDPFSTSYTPGAHERTADLFVSAWTTYSPETYDHSVGLVEQRLLANGFDRNYFAGKHCFDGGCGTGRLSIAMARMGAAKVTAADIGGGSLEFFKEVTKRYRLTNIEVVQSDVTRLTDFADESFDFVASNGVLHHTRDPLGGMKEHFRVTKRGGTFWIYLYGDGGTYWPVYDAMRSVIGRMDVAVIKKVLLQLGLREGFVYSYLDNVLAPRTYHTKTEIDALLSCIGPIQSRYAKGKSYIDDVAMCLATPFGGELFGAEGEVRLVVSKL